ncbi:MAG: triose-phosphate isomerase [Atopobiaceae bacterium]|jgi:triosephosphate isomerase
MRKPMIAGNWKMNETYSSAVVLAQGLARELEGGTGDVDVVVCPPAVDLKGVAEVIEHEQAPFALGGQNVYWEEKGAYTGETAPDMLTSVGATYCIIGHSERRGYFGETDEDVNKKAKALMAHDIVPISCCGESLEVREAGKHVAFVVDQIKKDTDGLVIEDPSKYVVAYEPIWAIGTGKTATADDAQEVIGAIRATLAEVFGKQTADGIRILYGGSAKPENVGGFLAKEDVDGALVGGASLVAEKFAAMVKVAMERSGD